MIDQDHAHDLRGEGEKVRAIGPIGRTLVAETKIQLADQTGGLQSMAGMLALQAAMSDAAQIGIYQRQQLLKRFRLAGLPFLQQPSDVARISHDNARLRKEIIPRQ